MPAPLRLLNLLPLLAGLCACSALAPTEAAPEPTADAAPRVAVCYSRLATSPAEIADTAAQECMAGSTPRLVSQEYNLSRCPVLTPIRATFSCAAH